VNRCVSCIPCGPVTYVYDAEGRRIRKTIAGGSSVDYLYDLAGHQITEVSSSGAWNRGEVYAGSRHIVTYDWGGTAFNHEDWLGTERARSNMSGMVCETITSLPYGDNESSSGSCSNYSPMHFTGKMRDTESNLDDFDARYYSSQWGRFTIADDASSLVLDAINPQRWNKYAYAVNNPASYNDPSGHDAAAVNFSGMVGGLGHEGILIIHNDGSGEYARFGPVNHGWENDFGASGSGRIDTYPLSTKVQFDSGGIPTEQSMADLAKEAAADEGVDPSTVRINYFKTTEAETTQLHIVVQKWQEAAMWGAGPYGHYNVTNNNCATFCTSGLVVANSINAAVQRSLSVDPNRLFWELSVLAHTSYVSKPAKKGSKVCAGIISNGKTRPAGCTLRN
jgi:RHS repeat-associated protein